MLADCASLSGSQYIILLLLLFIQVGFYKRHVYFQYGVVVTLCLMALYPLLLDPMPREFFSVLFILILLLYTVQLGYLSVYVPAAISFSVIVFLYLIVFLVMSTFLNTALFFTNPIDMAVGWWNTAENIGNTAKKVVDYEIKH